MSSQKKESSTTKVKWIKSQPVLGRTYYYAYFDGKFWCVPDYAIKEDQSVDYESMFQVRAESQLSDRARHDQMVRLSHLFPEMDREQIKSALNK